MTVAAIKGLIFQYGEQTTLGEILRKVQGDRIYKCPKCNGVGHITVEYNAYPEGLPDSGFVYERAFKDVKCDLCNGEAYTAHEYKPKMVQDGWE